MLGAGVAGLQAIATAKRLGAVVQAYDVRAAAAEEIRSMGAKSIDLELETLEGSGGYAREMTEDRAARQRELLAPYIANADALITTAAVPGRTAPMLVTAEMVEQMKPGSVVVDLAAESGRQRRGLGGRQGRAHRARRRSGAATTCRRRCPARPRSSTRRTSSTCLTLMTHEGEFAPDFDDEVVAGAAVTHAGRIVHEPTREAIEGPIEEPRQPLSQSPSPEPVARPPGLNRPSTRAIPSSPSTRRPTVNEAIVWLTIFVLSVFVGIEVISKVSSTLHTPLMSGANAIHGIILLGAILVTGTTDNGVAVAVGLVAIVLAAVNMVGGFVVTDRMLQMFTRKKKKPAAVEGAAQ